MPGSFSQATLLIELVAIVLVVVAIGVPQWSTSKVFRVFVVGNETNRGQEGSVEVGLWQACANLPGEIVFAGGEGLRDCRQGHCIRDTEFTRNTDQESNDLCHRSKESAGFVLLGLAAIISAAWVTAGQRFLGRKESHGLATFWAVVAFLSTLISWAVWLGWQGAMNGDQVTNPLKLYNFSRFNPGISVVLNIISTLLMIPVIIFERVAYNHDVEAEKKRRRNKTKRNRPEADNAAAEMQPMEDAPRSKPPVPAVKPRQPAAEQPPVAQSSA